MRAGRELVEIRAASLRFTSEEVTAYLNEVMGLAVTAPDVAALEGRTEGWIVVLQLAALSMQGGGDVAGFISSFADVDRFIVDYLAGEVLQHQPEHVRSFLLETYILSRLNGSLCDAVTGEGGENPMLEVLERGNLFLVPLDHRRLWYRYHHLIADVLRSRLFDEQPNIVQELHPSASGGYEHHAERPEAIRHAMAGEDFERAADLIELAVPTMSQTRQKATVRRGLEELPTEVFQVRPVLSLAFVGALMATGQGEGRRAPAECSECRAVSRGRRFRWWTCGPLQPTWWSQTTRGFGLCQVRSRCTEQDRRDFSGTSRAA